MAHCRRSIPRSPNGSSCCARTTCSCSRPTTESTPRPITPTTPASTRRCWPASPGTGAAGIPQSLVDREVAHAGLTDLRVVGTMHERKALMADLADGVIALPGGTGTLDELFELFTWSQLGLHHKPIGLLDVAGYWQPLLTMLDHMVDERFLRAQHRETLLVDARPEPLLERFAAYEYRPGEKWVDRQRVPNT